MTKSLLSILLVVTAAFLFAACSDDAPPPDGNAVQVGERQYEDIPIADIPTDFTTAPDALAAGNRLFDAGETERAIDALLQAVKLDPDLAEAYFKLGIAYALVEKEDTSVDQPDETPTPGPKSKKPEEKKKNSEKAFETAVKAYKKILSKNKEDDVAHFYLGLTYNKLNEDEDSAKSLKEAVRLKPDNTEYQTELGAINIKLAKYDEAVSALKKALDLDPSNIDAEELLEKAQAGKRRVDFAQPKKDEKQTGSGSSSNSSSNAASNAKSTTSSNTANAAKPPTMKPAKAPPAAAKTPK